jgi:hypothetical protein
MIGGTCPKMPNMATKMAIRDAIPQQIGHGGVLLHMRRSASY